MEHAAVPGMIREQRLNEWIEAYSDPILRTCFLYLSDRGQAEDALQDTWIKAWKHMDEYEKNHIANDKAWLLRIAVNTCKDAGSQSLACNVSLAGKLMVTVAALPLYIDILNSVLSLVKG